MKKKISLLVLFALVLVVSLTLIACDQTTTYTVTFDSDGGTAAAAQTIEEGKTATQPTGVTKEGYTLEGWYNGEDKWDFSTPITSNITLKAKWEKNVYTVIFDSDGGTTVAAKPVTHGEQVAEPTDVTKEGHNLDGWYLNETKWNFDDPVTGNMTLKAKWSPKTFTVSFDTDGGTPEVADKPATYGQPISAPTGITKEGYTLDGWYTASGVKWNFNDPVTGNMTLKAHWEIIQFTVTFDSNGGSAGYEVTVDYGQTVQEPTTITKGNYTLTGWKTVGGDDFDFDTPILDDITLVAQWQSKGAITIPSQFVGTWIGTEVIDTDSDMSGSTDYVIVIKADGSGTVDYVSEVDTGIFGTFTQKGSFYYVLFIVEDENLVMYFRLADDRAEQRVEFELDDEITMSTDAGPMSHMYHEDLPLTLTKKELKLADLVGTWEGTETVEDLGDFIYTIVIDEDGNGTADFTWFGDPDYLEDVSFEIQDGKLLMHFTYDDEEYCTVFEFDGETLTTDLGPMNEYYEEEGELVLTKKSAGGGDDFDPSTATLADFVGTWTGSGTAYGSMSIDYTIVIGQEGIVSVIYTMGYGDTALIDVRSEFADGVLTIYFKDYENNPEKHFDLMFNGKNVYTERDGVFGVAITFSKVYTFADMAGTWTGSGTAYGSMSIDYTIEIDDTGIVSIIYTMGYGDSPLIDLRFEYEDGVFTVYFKDYENQPEKSFTITFDGTNLHTEKDGVFGVAITFSRQA